MEADQQFMLAVRAYEAGRYDEAARISGEILLADPKNFRALNMSGMCLHESGDSVKGAELLQQAIALNPEYVPALNNLAAIQAETGNFPAALASVDRVLALAPDAAEFHLHRAGILLEMREYALARESVDRALLLDPQSAEGHSVLAQVLTGQRHFEKALASHKKALLLAPQAAKLWLNEARTFAEMGRSEDALEATDRAEALHGDMSKIWLTRGNIYERLKDLAEALACYRRATDLKPTLIEALHGYGRILMISGHGEEALEVFDRALALAPMLAEAWLARGYALDELRRYPEAMPAFEKAAELKPQLPYILGERLYARMRLCAWDGFKEDRRRILEAVENAQPATSPLPFLSISSSPAAQLQCQKNHVARSIPPVSRPLWSGQKYSHDKIRLAYVSADLGEHVVSQVAASAFEAHDRSRFELTALNFGASAESVTRSRLLGAFDRFVDMREKNDREIAALIREMEIDIVVDPSGFTKHARTAIIAHRPAPVQVNWLGFAGTMGADYFDYIVADETVIRPQEEKFYAEKVAYLPDSFFPADDKRSLPGVVSRAAAGLPETGFVFCAFNASQKFTPDIFSAWMRILARVEGSVLWLSNMPSEAKDNLRREAEVRGVSGARLIFAPRVPKAEDHISRLALAGLFLDTRPYNAHATANDALWAGVPVLTCPDETFAGRVAASLSKAAAVSETIVPSMAEYETLAVRLAGDPVRLASIRAKLAQNRKTAPLFDTVRFTRHLEAAYATMAERQARGEKPQSFRVAPIA